MNVDRDKMALNAMAKAALRAELKAKTWVQKVDSIARMNKAGKQAKEAMRRAKDGGFSSR
jgi:hypothetical protein